MSHIKNKKKILFIYSFNIFFGIYHILGTVVNAEDTTLITETIFVLMVLNNTFGIYPKEIIPKWLILYE